MNANTLCKWQFSNSLSLCFLCHFAHVQQISRLRLPFFYEPLLLPLALWWHSWECCVVHSWHCERAMIEQTEAAFALSLSLYHTSFWYCILVQIDLTIFYLPVTGFCLCFTSFRAQSFDLWHLQLFLMFSLVVAPVSPPISLSGSLSMALVVVAFMFRNYFKCQQQPPQQLNQQQPPTIHSTHTHTDTPSCLSLSPSCIQTDKSEIHSATEARYTLANSASMQCKCNCMGLIRCRWLSIVQIT